MSVDAHARYPHDAEVLARHRAPQGADTSDAQGESDIDQAIRLRQSTDWQAQEWLARPGISPPYVLLLPAVYEERIQAAKAAGARQERRASQRIITPLAAGFTVSLIGNLIQWVLRP